VVTCPARMPSIPIINFNELGDLDGPRPDIEAGWRSIEETTFDSESDITTFLLNRRERRPTNAFNRRTTRVRDGIRTAGRGVASVSRAASVVGASASGAIETVGVIPGAALIGAGAAVAGYGVYHYPGHSYLGPGTDIASAKRPVDTDDKIAQAHDIAYSKARSDKDIKEADSKAIGAFEDDFAATGNLHSKLAGGLLGIKQAVEHYTGPLYPQVMVRALGPPC
jgi:hypothetical protein